jgi:nicotinamide-nucleotide amidase
MNAQILSIGNELTIGKSVDTNAPWLAGRLAAVGILCSRHITVADDRQTIAREIVEAAKQAGLVMITGGLGPTPDDLTREALADAMGVGLVFRPECLAQIEAYFRSRNRAMHPKNRQQALCPAGAEPLENTRGTAPGISARIGSTEIFVLPGVPGEMTTMFERSVLPRLPRGGAVILQHTLQAIGMSEAEIGERLADLMQRGRNPAVGTSAADLVISIHIHANGRDEREAAEILGRDAAAVQQRLGTAVFGEGKQSLQHTVGHMLIDARKSIATAESCTGGLIAKRLSDVPGSSAYLSQGFVTYSNEAKHRLLHVSTDLIEAHGAVSAPVAEAMAENCRRISNTDYALSATGIAGPGGGTAQKPVGLVYVGLADADHVVVKELRLGETLSREEIRDRTAKAALNLLRLELISIRADAP